MAASQRNFYYFYGKVNQVIWLGCSVESVWQSFQNNGNIAILHAQHKWKSMF